jgi:probable rRNA maturation factor
MSVTLEWNNEQSQLDISDSLIDTLNQLLALAAEAEQVEDGEVALSFVDDEAIRELNRTYRGLDKPTDVLSFAMQEIGQDELEIIYDTESDDQDSSVDGEQGDGAEFIVEPLGDIIISVERAAAQAADYGHSFERELGFLFVHGFLHLIGYDHQDEASEKRMFAKQEAILQKAGLTR